MGSVHRAGIMEVHEARAGVKPRRGSLLIKPADARPEGFRTTSGGTEWASLISGDDLCRRKEIALLL